MPQRLSPISYALVAAVACTTATKKVARRMGHDSGAPQVLALVSIDGLMPAQALSAEASGVAVPNLASMVRDGAFATGVRTVVPSVTFPAHTTLLTGVSPAVHGIASNLVFDPMRRNKDGWYWYASDIRVPTLWDVARAAGLKTANVYWPVSVGAPVDFNFVQYWRAALPDDAKLYEQLSTPHLVDELIDRVGPVPYGSDCSPKADERRERYAEYLIGDRHPDFVTVYLGSLDEAAHHEGIHGRLTLLALQHVDALIGRLRAALERVAPGHYVMAVVSDHGFMNYDTEVELDSLLRQRNFITLDADNQVVSWSAAAWVEGGTGAMIVNPSANADAKTAVARFVQEFEQDPQYGVERVFRGSEVALLEGYRGADYVFALQPGFKFGRRLMGPSVLYREGATHGYLPDVPGMDAAFFVVGVGIPKFTSLGRVDMRDIAPTLAGLESLELPQAQGVDRLARFRHQGAALAR